MGRGGPQAEHGALQGSNYCTMRSPGSLVVWKIQLDFSVLQILPYGLYL